MKRMDINWRRIALALGFVLLLAGIGFLILWIGANHPEWLDPGMKAMLAGLFILFCYHVACYPGWWRDK